MPQIKKPDYLQSIANLIRFFCVCMTIAFQDENNPKQFLMAQRADLSGAAFGKITAVYGQISQKWHFVRNLSEILDRLVEQYCCLKKIVFIHWKLKKPDKGSRNSTAFVRLFV